MGMKQMLLHLLEDLIILIIQVFWFLFQADFVLLFQRTMGDKLFCWYYRIKTGIKTRLGNAETLDGKSIFCNENGSR
jgi:hypothetical protein